MEPTSLATAGSRHGRCAGGSDR